MMFDQSIYHLSIQRYRFCYNLMVLADRNCESLTEIKLRETAALYYKEV